LTFSRSVTSAAISSRGVDERSANAACRYRLGFACLKADRKAKARRAFEDALRLQPDSPAPTTPGG
jgi:Flp pilus assembly protein TadD